VIGIITGLIGYLLFLTAVYRISRIYKDKEIFYLSLFGIFLSTVSFLFVFISGISLGLLAGPKWLVMLLMLIAIGLYIYGYFLIYKALIKVKEYTKVSTFGLGGKVLLLGALLILIFIGVLVILIGWFIVSIAFFKLPEESNIVEYSNT
jgi:uncharacterized membrane protein